MPARIKRDAVAKVSRWNSTTLHKFVKGLEGDVKRIEVRSISGPSISLDSDHVASIVVGFDDLCIIPARRQHIVLPRVFVPARHRFRSFEGKVENMTMDLVHVLGGIFHYDAGVIQYLAPLLPVLRIHADQKQAW